MGGWGLQQGTGGDFHQELSMKDLILCLLEADNRKVFLVKAAAAGAAAAAGG